jgi:glycosyltransferase involved in cell wall biosynthesis
MVVHAYYPIGETRVQREALALIDRGHAVDVLCLRAPGEPARAEHEGVAIRRLPVRRHRDRGFAVQLLEYLAFFVAAAVALSARHLRRPYDAVQVHNLPDFLVFCALVPRLSGAAVLLDLHDLMPEFFASRLDVGMAHPLVRLMLLQERLACRFAHQVITVTEGWRQVLIRRGVPAERVTVVMNVADARVFTRTGLEPSTSGSERLELLYHGTLTQRYGVDLLVEAVALVRDDLPHVHLSLLGDGDLRPELEAQRARLGLREHVTISDGMVDVSRLPAAIRSADVGVVPTRPGVFTDGLLPTKLMEFVAMGTPVIAARTPTVASYFDDDMVQFFVPGDAGDLAEAIRALAADPARRRALADNADAFNRKYDSASMAAGFVTAVDDAISRS